MVPGSAELREYLEDHAPGVAAKLGPEKPLCTTLPDGFRPFGLSPSYVEGPYLSYLRDRGVTEQAQRLYRIGFCDDGMLGRRVVVPSFDQHGSINFWSARAIDEASIPHYRLPHASKDIISNEHMVDWTKPIYLVEGIFDEIAIGPQAIAMYGKFMQQKLALRLVEKRPPMVYACLDADAPMETRALMKRLVGYDVPCARLDLKGKDPGAVGSVGVAAAVVSASTCTSPIDLLRGRL